jgi:hypothetical protein
MIDRPCHRVAAVDGWSIHMPASGSVRARVRVSSRLFLLFLALVMGGSVLPGLPGGDARLAAQAPAMRWDGFFELISGRYNYPPPWPAPPESANAPSRISRHAISGDGRWVIFESDATNLGFSTPGLYRRDRRTGQTEILLGGPAKNAAISADGNHIAFEVCDPWMRSDNQPICDVWALDLREWSWRPLSVTPDGTLSTDHSGAPVLSADGRFAAFMTKASNLTGGAGGGTQQIVIRDRDADGNGIFDEPNTAVLETISVSGVTAGELANGDSDSVEISNDGRFVAFRSSATNLVPGDTNGLWDLFLRDRLSGETRRLNVRPSGEQSPFAIDSTQVSMSADGRYVAFASADNLLTVGSIDDNNGALDVFVYDAQSSSLSRIDVGWTAGGGATLGNGPTAWPTLSADGRYVSLQSAATNVEAPSTAGRTQVFVVDRDQARATRVSVLPNGVEPYGVALNGVEGVQDSVRPTISADASVVMFWSLASNYTELAAPPVAEQLYAAVHLEIAPAEIVVHGRGGVGTFTVTTQQHTNWWAMYDWSQQWIGTLESAPYGVGSGSMTFQAREPNPNPTRRTTPIRVGTASADFTQDVGLSITSVSPSSGPMSGGTTVTITGTSFEPGMWVHFGGGYVPAQFVDSTTLTAVTPPHDRRMLVPVAISNSTFDYNRFTFVNDAFLYLDSTPPFLGGWTTGNQGENGWYTGDVSVYWGWWDEQSEVTSTTCVNTVVTTDTAGTTLTCTATSEGGTATASVTFKRDTTAPTIAITSPIPWQLFELNSTATANFTCDDATSGVAGCGSYPGANVIDTSYTGFRQFWVTAMDAAGNVGVSNVDYAVSNGYCAQPMFGMKAWLRFDDDLTDVLSPNVALNTGMPPDSYVAGEVGQAYNFVPRGSQSLEFWHDGRLNFTSSLTVAMWLKPGSATLGTLIKHKDQFRLERTAHGTINWMLFHPDASPSFGTSYARAPLNEWSHVVFTYNAGEVKVYVNGRLDRTWNVSPPTLQWSPPWWNRIRIGGPDEFGGSPYVGAFDELQFFDRPLAANEIEYMFLSGASGTCVPQPTVLEVPSPITTTYGAGTYPASAVLRTATGEPLSGKTITLYQMASDDAGEVAPTTTLVTDVNGTVYWQAPFDVVAGSYAQGFKASFEGDPQYAYATPVTATVNVEKATPSMNVTGGTFTYASQPHAATASATDYRGGALTPVTITYNGSSDVPVAAGVYSVVAAYAGDANHLPHSVTATLTINKATPSLSWTAPAAIVYGTTLGATQLNATASVPGSFAYTPASGTWLDAGPAHTLSATFTPADAINYEGGTVTTTLTVQKATPTVNITGGSFTYDGGPHGATAFVTGVPGSSLGPVTIKYNGSTDLPVNAGSYEAVATFAGDNNYESASASATVTITKAAASLSWNAPASIVYGTALGAAQLNAQANVAGTFAYSPAAGTVLGAGAGQPLTATFTPADPANYTGGTVATAIAVSPAALVVRANDAAKVYGAPVPAFTAAFAGFVNGDSAASLSGALVFATNATSSSAVGMYPVVPGGLSSPNYAIAFVNGTLTIVKGAVTVSVSISPEPSGYEQPMTFTATVLPVQAAPTAPQGTVRFFDGTTLIGTATIAGNSATLTTAGLDAGTRTIEARYDGDASFEIGTGSASHVVNAAAATPVLSITSSRNPSSTGQSVTLTANVSMSSGAVTGSIAFYDGATLLGTSTISSGRATRTISTLAAGSHAITARFLGSAGAPPAISPVFVQAVGASGWRNRTTSTSLSSSANPSTSGAAVTFTATVTGSSSSTPTGRILFMVDGQVVGDPAGVPVTTVSSTVARATLSVPGLAHGRHKVSAIYLGDSTYRGSAGALTQTVN